MIFLFENILNFRKLLVFSKNYLLLSKSTKTSKTINLFLQRQSKNLNNIFYKKKISNLTLITIFLRDLFTINLTQNVNKFFSTNKHDLKSLFKVKQNNPVFNYNLKNVYKELYNTYIFFLMPAMLIVILLLLRKIHCIIMKLH